MPFSDDLVSTYGAVADGQWSKQAFTITAGSKNLHSPVPLWAPGDQLKPIVVGNAGGNASGNAGGGQMLFSTIDTVTDSQNIILHDAALVTLPAGAFGRTNFIVAWGTNNASAFAALQVARADQTGTLNIPAGTYLVVSGNFGSLFSGIANITVNATGVTICGGVFQLGGGSHYEDTLHQARTAEAFIGATSVNCLVTSESNRFVVGDYAVMTSVCLQPNGFPINPYLFEYVRITGASAGTVTFASPLTENHLTTLPDVGIAGTMDYAGPACLYALKHSFNGTHVHNNLTIAHDSAWAISGLSNTFNNCVFESDYGPFPTTNKDLTFNNCSNLTGDTEFDKLVYNVVLSGCTWNTLTIQSSNHNLTIDNSAINGAMTGCFKHTTISDSSIAVMALGALYGSCQTLKITGGSVGSCDNGQGHKINGGTASASNGIQNDFTMTGGVIRIPRSLTFDGQVTRFMVPRSHLFFLDGDSLGNGTLGRFQILSITQDNTDYVLSTDWAHNGFPAIANPVNPLGLMVHFSPQLTVTDVVGMEGWNDAPDGGPVDAYWKATFTAAAVPPTAYNFVITGKLLTVKINVTKAYTGPGGATVDLYDNQLTKISNNSLVPFAAQSVNLKVPGERVFNTRSGYPASWSGVQSGDSLGATVSEDSWSGYTKTLFITDLSSATALQRPEFTVEFTSDQGIIGATVHFRYHKI